MTLKLVDAGLIEKMNRVTDYWNVTPVRIHLFKNNVTPTTASVIGDFTEADFPGYAAQDVVNWTAPGAAAHIVSTQADPNTFTRTATGAGQDLYGYYVTDDTDAVLLWAERDPNAPITLTVAGDNYTVTPRMTDQDLST